MKTSHTFLGICLLSAGVAQAATIVALNLPSSGNHTSTVVTTSQSVGGATFEISYTIGARSNGASPFANSTGAQVGVGSSTDLAAHYSTLEGDDGEGLSFTGLSITNFQANGSGLLISDITELKFTSFSVNNANNAQDGVTISFSNYGVSSVNKGLNTGGAAQVVSLTGLANYPVLPSLATNLFINNHNANSTNRWAVTGLEVSYVVPEPGAPMMLFGGIGLLMLFRRRC